MTLPWVERHRPKTLGRVLGHPQAVADLRRWAESWKTGTPGQRAVILAGPPGSGKTSAAHALAAEMGWELIELNASDARNAAAIERVAGVGAVHQTFASSGEFRSTHRGGRKLIVLDEADNLYERGEGMEDASGDNLSDRGGKRAIADTVARTQQPIVLIVNDLYALTKGAGDRISRAALRINFHGIASPSVRKILREIALTEGVQVSEEVLQTIATRSEGDLRSAINDLEALAAGRTKVESMGELSMGERQRGTTAFDVVAAILKGQDFRRTIEAARELDETPDFLLAWLDENVPGEYRDLHDLERALGHLSRADVFLGRTMRRQQFGLWSYATEIMAAGVATAKTQRYGTPPLYRFPGWIRQMGASKGSRGSRDRLAEKLGRILHLGKRQLLREQLPDLRAVLRGDPARAASLAVEADLEEDEVRALFDDAPSRGVVDEVLARMERLKTESPAPTPGAPEPVKPNKVLRGRGTSLGDF